MNQFTTLLEAVSVPPQDYTPATVGVSKHTLANRINSLLAANSKGFFRDEDWSNVNRLFALLRDAGYPFEIKSADYLHDNDGTMRSKVWRFQIPFQQPSGREGILYGNLTASFTGTREDPSAAYDISAYVS